MRGKFRNLKNENEEDTDVSLELTKEPMDDNSKLRLEISNGLIGSNRTTSNIDVGIQHVNK